MPIPGLLFSCRVLFKNKTQLLITEDFAFSLPVKEHCQQLKMHSWMNYFAPWYRSTKHMSRIICAPPCLKKALREKEVINKNWMNSNQFPIIFQYPFDSPTGGGGGEWAGARPTFWARTGRRKERKAQTMESSEARKLASMLHTWMNILIYFLKVGLCCKGATVLRSILVCLASL